MLLVLKVYKDGWLVMSYHNQQTNFIIVNHHVIVNVNRLEIKESYCYLLNQDKNFLYHTKVRVPNFSLKMPFKFCPNISFLFNDIPFAQRYQQAKVLGFQGVESGFPYNVDPKELVEAKVTSGLEHILLNIYTGIIFIQRF